eukprot:3117_1
MSLSITLALIFAIIASAVHYYELEMMFNYIDTKIHIKYILSLFAVCIMSIEILRSIVKWCRSILFQKSGNNIIDHYQNGTFCQNSTSFDSYSSKEISIFLPIIIQTILCIPFNLLWYKHQLLLKLLQRIQNDRYQSLFQSFSFYINSNESILPTLRKICDQNSKLNKTLTKLIGNTTRNETAINYFNQQVYRTALKTIKTNNNKSKIISVPSNSKTKIYDPVNANNIILSHIKVKKLMASNAKPLLIECYSKKILSSKLLLKYGDDLRKDAAVLLMFRFINNIWKSNNISYNGIDICSFIYDVVAMNNKFGCIELIDECIKIADIDKTDEIIQLMNANMNNLIASAVGSCLCSYIVGVRDRHHDNILIKKDKGILFHIDFAYILGESVTGLDASRVSIPSNFVKVLGNDNWNKFIDKVTDCFLILRKYESEIIEYGCMIFKYEYDENKIKNYLSKSLCITRNNTNKEAAEYIRNKFLKSPSKIKTRMKNAIHDIAVKRIST